MSRFAKVFVVFIVVVGIGLAIGFWGSSRSTVKSVPLANEVPAFSNPPPEVASSREITRPRPGARTNQIPEQTGTAGVAPAQVNTNGIPNWEEKVDAILTSEIPDKDKAKKMLEMFPQLSPEAQEEVAHHLSNLVPDEEYAPLGNYLTNSTLPEPVLDVLLEDVFNRPNSVKLPLLLDIARNSQHPKAAESRDVLELFLEDDYGNDWSKWQAKMDQWLKENPD